MNKMTSVMLLLVGMALMAGGGYLLFAVSTGKDLGVVRALVPGAATTPMSPPAHPPAPAVKPSAAATPSKPTGVIQLSSATPNGQPTEPGVRRIAFRYRNAKARQVVIRIEFEGWKPKPMIRDGSGVWIYTAVDPIPAGEYGYYFVVDNQLIPRDPGNKKTKKIGTNVVSAITVAAPAPALAHPGQ